MGIFDDLFDDVADVVSDVAEPFAEVAKDGAEATGLDQLSARDLAVLAGLLGLEIVVVKAALAAGCSTLGGIREWADEFGGGGTSSGGGGSV